MTDAKYVKKAPRQSNLELSRILAMYLIVMHHFSVHGGVPIWSGSAPLSFNFYLDQLLSTGGKIGVNLTVLSSFSLNITSIALNVTSYALFGLSVRSGGNLIAIFLSTFSFSNSSTLSFSCSFVLSVYIPLVGVLWSAVFSQYEMIFIGLFPPTSSLFCSLRLSR